MVVVVSFLMVVGLVPFLLLDGGGGAGGCCCVVVVVVVVAVASWVREGRSRCLGKVLHSTATATCLVYGVRAPQGTTMQNLGYATTRSPIVIQSDPF